MKLVDRVKQLNKDELIYIGSKSAYFFIGYPDEFLQREKELTKEWFNKFSDAYDRASRALEIHEEKKPKEGETQKQRVQNLRTRQIEDRVISYEELYNNWLSRKKSLEKTLKSTSKYMDRFKPFSQRTIKEEYKRIQLGENSGNVIIIKGYEVGNYWLASDLKKKTIVIEDEEEYEEEFDE